MKKVIGLIAVVAISVSLFSFSSASAKKADFNELRNVQSKLLNGARSFQQYQRDHYTSNKGSWDYRMETWSLTAETVSLNELEKNLN
jgi:hypothetical protein